MIKIAIGLMLGLIISAAAQTITIPSRPNAIYAAGQSFEGNLIGIQTDTKGYVICSDYRAPL